MRRVLALSVLSLALCAACAHVTPSAASSNASATTAVEAGATTADARLNAWFERKYEEQLQFSPIQLSMLGRKDLYSTRSTTCRERARRSSWRGGSQR